MSKSYGLITAFMRICFCLLLCSCGGGSKHDESTARAVVFTDIHFNAFYDPSLFEELVAADASEWSRIFEKSSITEPSAYGADTNYPLLVRALSGIEQQVGDAPLVLFTGDLLGHNLPQTFFKLYGREDVAALKAFADKMVVFLTEKIRASVGNRPVLFALGNADSYTGLEPEADFLSNTAEIYYSAFLEGSADHAAYLESFAAGGYYSAKPYGADLRVIALNTMLFYPLPLPEAARAATAELAWLDSQLASSNANGERVWLLMHVPAGADIASTAKHVDGNGRLASTVMMWDADLQARFLEILSKYPGVITFALGAHTHMDEFRIMAGTVLHGSPSISPVFGNNPAFRVVTFSRTTLEALDYTTLSYDLAAMPKDFQSLYTFSSAYGMPELLDAASEALVPLLATDKARQSLYRDDYYSGPAPANPITDRNWPVYWCGITKLTSQELMSCVK